MKRVMGLIAAALLFVAGVCDAAAKDFRWSNDADVFSMDPHARADLASRLSAVLVQRYALTLDGEPEAFLERL